MGTKKKRDSLITKWEITTDDVLDDFGFKLKDFTNTEKYSYGICVKNILIKNAAKEYLKLISPKYSKQQDQLIITAIDKSIVLKDWILDHAEHYFCDLQYPDENMYWEFWNTYLDNTVIKGDHCEKCFKRIQCELRGSNV
jgi:hypothetical protein